MLSSHFFAISILNPNYDVINDVISGFTKVVIERCSFHHWIAQTISWGEVVSVFLYLLYTVSQKKGATLSMAITLSIVDRFPEFFHCCKEQ